MEHQVAEIAGVQCFQAFLIAGIKSGTFSVGIGFVLNCIEIGRVQPTVFPAVDQTGKLARWPTLFIKFSFGDELLQEA